MREEVERDGVAHGGDIITNAISEMGSPVVATCETGCYVDGHHGIYAYARVCEIAKGFGYPGRVLTDEECRGSLEDCEITDVVDDVETWLNDNVAQPGYSFGWFDGEFFYSSQEDWQEIYS